MCTSTIYNYKSLIYDERKESSDVLFVENIEESGAFKTLSYKLVSELNAEIASSPSKIRVLMKYCANCSQFSFIAFAPFHSFIKCLLKNFVHRMSISSILWVNSVKWQELVSKQPMCTYYF